MWKPSLIGNIISYRVWLSLSGTPARLWPEPCTPSKHQDSRAVRIWGAWI